MLNRTVLLIEISEYRCWQLAIDLLSTLGKLSLSSRTLNTTSMAMGNDCNGHACLQLA